MLDQCAVARRPSSRPVAASSREPLQTPSRCAPLVGPAGDPLAQRCFLLGVWGSHGRDHDHVGFGRQARVDVGQRVVGHHGQPHPTAPRSGGWPTPCTRRRLVSGRRPRRAERIGDDRPAGPQHHRDSQPTLRDWRGRRPALGWAGLRRPRVGLPHRQHRPRRRRPPPARPRTARRRTDPGRGGAAPRDSGRRRDFDWSWRCPSGRHPLPGHPGHDHASSEIGKPSASRPRPRLLRGRTGCCTAQPLSLARRSGRSASSVWTHWVTTGSAMSRSTWVQSIPPKGDGGRTRSTTGPSGRSARRSAGRPAPRPGRSRLTPRPR